MAQNRIERLQVETLRGQQFFQDLLSRDVYFDDFDDRSSNYFRLSYDPSFILHGGKNLISIRGNSDTMEQNSQILIEAIDSQGDLVKTQVYDLNDDAHNRVIAIDITPETPPGEIIITLLGVASRAPDGSAIPGTWQNIVNFRWTRQFTCQPKSPNSSKIIYNQFSKPVIKIEEIKKPFYELSYNQQLSSSIGWSTDPAHQNQTSSYTLSSSVNTLAQVSYRKSADKFWLTLSGDPINDPLFVDFGGFTKDMEDGIIIVRTPQSPRPASINGYYAAPAYAETEQGDGLYEDISWAHPTSTVPTMSYVTGAFLSTIKEVLSPYEARVSTPHTTWQGTTAAQYQEFEHYEFAASNFELIWSETPISYSASPTASTGDPLNTSYAHVTFDNLVPLTGDVTRVKCYMKNHQAPFDWVIASDNAIWAQELLFRRDFQKYRAPIGDFSQWGVAHNGITSLQQYWETSGVGISAPSMSLHTQNQAGDNPPVADNLKIGDNSQALQLDGTGYWWLKAKESASFYQDQWYELSFKAVSVKTQLASWLPLPDPAPIQQPKMSIYMSGSAFIDGGDDLGKFVGLIEDIAVKKKHVTLDPDDDFKEKGYKFIFKADGTETGLPQFKIDAGTWHMWDISIKPWDRDGYTPGTWDVIFPTIKCNVGKYDSLDFKFEFYNDYGMISNYTAIIDKVPWQNELTATFTNIVTNTISGSTGSFGQITTNGPNIFNSSSTFNGPTTFSSGVTMSGPVVMGGPITMSGPGLFGQNCNDSWITSGSIYFPCLPEASQSKIVNWDPTTGQLKVTSSTGLLGGSGAADQNLFETIAVAGQTSLVADTTTDTVTFVAGTNITLATNATTDAVTWSAADTNTNQLTIWKLDDGAGSSTDISHGETVVIAGGANITTSRASNTITISSTTGGSSGGADCANNFATFSISNHGTTTYVTASDCGDTANFIAGSNMVITQSGMDITFTSTGGGGAGGTCCSTCIGAHDDWPGWDMCGSYLVDTAEIQGCPMTIGFTKPNLNHFYVRAEHYSRYAESTWLQVNNWSGPLDNMKTNAAAPYAAIFNTTGAPLDLDGDGIQQCCTGDNWTRAGHGIKVMTSTVPWDTTMYVYSKGSGTSKFQSCTWGNGLEPQHGGNPNGLPNAFYISFYHYEPDCSTGGFRINSSVQHYAGGIRKDCTDYTSRVVYEITSDRRLKEDIEPTRWGLKDLMKIRIRDFYYKKTPEERRHVKTVGVIAQELGEIFPQAVGGKPYGDELENPMTVAPDDLVYLLIQSVQDQQKKIEELETRIKNMESK